ncbi:hypothetical protein Mal15_00990 [Stieleria maiorica]|uniref:ABC-2 family transporter protein n=1 Tax=Stieleria maiorica TaxID=2795974 RepID=A0A5B9M608_9BACT|nr:ABC transporter permease [Stieleria maiorica]QEF96073.1 hypothetical protein Mal15_00990 [Stieleria maiorica]
MNHKILQRMIWKDARTVRALAIATPAMIVGFFLLLGLFTGFTHVGTERMGLAYAIWMLLPMLIACGAPAVLIGGEEESGSLAWLQTLPAGWKTIAASKLLVTSVCLLLAWIVATGCFLMYWSALSDYWINRIRQSSGLPEPFWIHCAGAVALSIAVMLSSFTTAYWFRSPITALVLLFPLLMAAIWAVVYASIIILPAAQFRGPPQRVIEQNTGTFALLIAVALLLLAGLSLLAAWRRLTWPESRGAGRVLADSPTGAFRPPPDVTSSKLAGAMVFGRPRPLFALLWLQVRPIRWQLVLLTMMAIAGALFTALPNNEFLVVGYSISILPLFMIAALTFYSDSVRKRCVFLYDRGISPTRVWLTRVGPTLCATAIVLAIMVLAGTYREASGVDREVAWSWDNRLVITAMVVIAGFALTQLVSQWSPRPTLAFFAGPVFVQLAAFVLAGLLMFYTRASAVLLLSSAILLLASWHLTSKWMAGEKGKVYVAPMVGFIAAALFLPYVVLLAARYVTTPAPRVAWRQQMYSIELPHVDPTADKVAILDPAYVRRLETLALKPAVSQEGRQDRIAKELAATESIGQHVSFKEVMQVLNVHSDSRMQLHQDFARFNLAAYLDPHVYPAAERFDAWRTLQFDAVRVLLKWSRETREQAVRGGVNFNVLMGVAEVADLVAGRVIKAYVDQDGMTPELKELIQLVPQQDLVQQSRRNSLIRSWRQYQSKSLGEQFAGEYSHKPTQWWLAVERARADRYVDELCKYMLDQWESGENFRYDGLAEIQRLEHEAYLVSGQAVSNYFQDPELSERIMIAVDADWSMDQVRRQVAD